MSLDNVRKRAKIPGFRQGNAPVTMIEKKFGNDIKADIIDRLVPEYYSKALKEADLVLLHFRNSKAHLILREICPFCFRLRLR